MRRKRRLDAAAALSVLVLGTAPAAARTLQVGAGLPYPTPSAAAAAAHDGDRVAIAAGRYTDCAVWRANGLTIEGAGMEATVIAGPVCQDMALFVIQGHDTTVRRLTLAGAHASTFNGAGIRATGGNLTVEQVRFRDDEDGILAASDPAARLLVRDSTFEANGSCAGAGGCAHGLYANRIALLRVERSTFLATRSGHHIKSRALRTEIVGCRIEDGPDGTASYSIDMPNGGALLLQDSAIEKGPRAENRSAAVAIGEEGASNPAGPIQILHNSFRVDGGYAAVLLANATTTPAQVRGNTLRGGAAALRGPGDVR